MSEVRQEEEKSKELYERLLREYAILHGNSRQALEHDIESFTKQGLSREEAIKKLAEKSISQEKVISIRKPAASILEIVIGLELWMVIGPASAFLGLYGIFVMLPLIIIGIYVFVVGVVRIIPSLKQIDWEKCKTTYLTRPLIICIITDTVFTLATWYVGGNAIAYGFPMFLFFYLSGILALGTFLAGLILGFSVKERRKSAYYSFICAVVPSLFLSFYMALSSPYGVPSFALFLRNPFAIPVVQPTMIYFNIIFPFDALALVGGAIAPSIRTKRLLGLLVLSTLIPISTVTVHGLMFGPKVASGDNVFDSNQFVTVENSIYMIENGDLILKDNATLLIRNAEFILDVTDVYFRFRTWDKYHIILRNSSHLIVENARLGVVDRLAGPPRGTILVMDNAEVVISKSVVASYILMANQSSNVKILDSEWIYEPISAYDQSNISIINSKVEGGSIGCWGTSRVLVKNTSLFVVCNDKSSVVVKDSVLGLETSRFNGTLGFDSAKIIYQMRIDSLSNFYLYGNVTIEGTTRVRLDGQVTRNYIVKTTPGIELEVTNNSTGSMLLRSQSDIYGFARFNVTFTSENCTSTLLINKREPFSLTSTTPLTYIPI